MAELQHILDQVHGYGKSGDIEAAVRFCSDALASRAWHADERAWINWHAFHYGVQRGAEYAFPFGLAVLNHPPSPGILLYVAALMIKHASASGDHEAVEQVAAGLNTALVDWSSRVPSPAIDFPLHLIQEAWMALYVAGALDLVPELAGTGIVAAESAFVGSIQPQPLDLAEPRLYNSIPGRLRHSIESWGAHRLSPLNFREVTGGLVLFTGTALITLDAHGRPLSSDARTMPRFLARALEQQIQGGAPVVDVPGTTLVIADTFTNGHNISHWTLDWLARIVGAGLAEVAFDRVAVALPLTQCFETATLARLGVGDVLEPTPGTLYRCARLIVPSNLGPDLRHPCFHGHRDLLKCTASRLGGERRRSGTRRLYVPRSHSRRVVNGAELYALLEQHGFDSINTDLMSYEEQVSAFSDAECIVAPHGAALTSIIFCPERCRLLELFPRYGGSAAYIVVSQALGIEYSMYADTLTDPRFDVEASMELLNNDADLLVDLRFVERWLAAAPTWSTFSE